MITPMMSAKPKNEPRIIARLLLLFSEVDDNDDDEEFPPPEFGTGDDDLNAASAIWEYF